MLLLLLTGGLDYQGPRRGERHYGYHDYEDDYEY